MVVVYNGLEKILVYNGLYHYYCNYYKTINIRIIVIVIVYNKWWKKKGIVTIVVKMDWIISWLDISLWFYNGS